MKIWETIVDWSIGRFVSKTKMVPTAKPVGVSKSTKRRWGLNLKVPGVSPEFPRSFRWKKEFMKSFMKEGVPRSFRRVPGSSKCPKTESCWNWNWNWKLTTVNYSLEIELNTNFGSTGFSIFKFSNMSKIVVFRYVKENLLILEKKH